MVRAWPEPGVSIPTHENENARSGDCGRCQIEPGRGVRERPLLYQMQGGSRTAPTTTTAAITYRQCRHHPW